ncbi:hypothetical protein L1987_52682 [Smallanthus sonchifolius]|uniref:Uncharacterized protein n=1 Tax=Smallanthus sonchifolius TaxID=185202 RepID=A0ACB9ETU1_9ASTR|nr:hypothetical protein L1987_52682 [Smallanthus sonchifolius]
MEEPAWVPNRFSSGQGRDNVVSGAGERLGWWLEDPQATLMRTGAGGDVRGGTNGGGCAAAQRRLGFFLLNPNFRHKAEVLLMAASTRSTSQGPSQTTVFPDPA